jgi:hypothetical protein
MNKAPKKEQYALLIRPAEQRIERVPLTAKITLAQLYEWIGCSLVETLNLDDRNCLVFDEEPGRRANQSDFLYGGDIFPVRIVGNCLVVGTRRGEMVGTSCDMEDLEARIVFNHVEAS